MLPSLLMLTDRHQLPCGVRLVEHVARAVAAGVRAVILRERDLEDRERCDLAFDLAQVLSGVGGRLIVAAPELGLPHGVHLRARDPYPTVHAPVVGRSCHGAAELQRAQEERLDYVLLGPVAASRSKPGYGPALGIRGLATLTRHAREALPRDPSVLPAIYALGGVHPGNAADWIAAGADGVAVMGALMRTEDPASVVVGLLAALPSREVSV